MGSRARRVFSSQSKLTGRPAASSGPQEVSVSLEIRSGGSAYDEFLLKELRRAIRVRGGNVNFVLTGRTS